VTAGTPRLGIELPRKAVHLGVGAFAVLLRWLTPGQAALCALAALLFNLLLLHRLTRSRLLREAERRRGFSWGIALYPAAVLALILVFRGRLELAAAVWGLLAFGDGMATVCGLLVGGPRLPWNRAKTWSGLVAFVLWGTAAAAFLMRWTQRAVPDAAAAGSALPDWVGGSFLAVAGGGPTTWLVLGCLTAAAAAAFAESLDTGVDDNVVVPMVGGATLWAATLVQGPRLAAAAETLGQQFAWGAAVNGILAVAAFAARGVGPSGAVWGWVLGTALYGFAGWRGFLMLLVFFVLGTATTRSGYARKAALGIAQDRGGRRGARNAFANVSAGLLFAFLAAATAYPAAMTVALAAAFSTATCDTVSSEIGQAYGRRHYLITTFRRVRAGTDGAVSLEGTLSGWLGALVVAAAAWGAGLVGAVGFAAVAAGGVAGATFESYLDALAGGRLRLDNELVNFLNTLVGGLVGAGLYAVLA
jgi:uncharacterized protein (TIGR00297 family)